MRLKELARCSKKIFQLEIIWSLQCKSKALCIPAFTPQDILTEATWPGTDVSKIQQII